MKLKYYLRGMGIGIILTAIIMGIALRGRKETLTDAEIMARARELGMIDATVLSDYAVQNQQGDALGGNGENGNAADGSAAASVKSVTQTGDTAHSVVFEPLLPQDYKDASNGSGAGASSSKEAAPSSAASSAGTVASSSAATEKSSSVADASSSAATAAAAASKNAAEASSSPATGASSSGTASSESSAIVFASLKKAPDNGSTGAGTGASAATGASAKTAATANTSDPAQSATKPAATDEANTESSAAAASTRAATAQVSPAGTEDQTDTEQAHAATAGKKVVIPGGVGSETVAAVLEREGLIDSAAAFDRYLCDQHLDRILRSGEKTIPEDATYAEIAAILTK